MLLLIVLTTTRSAFVARIPADGIACNEKDPGGTLLTPSCKKPDAGFKEPNLCNDTALDTISYLDNLRTKFSRNLFIAHLKVNSLRYIFFKSMIFYTAIV